MKQKENRKGKEVLDSVEINSFFDFEYVKYYKHGYTTQTLIII